MDKIAVNVLAGLLLSGMTHAECHYSFDAHPTQLAMYSLLQEGNTTMLKPLVTTSNQQISMSLPDVPQKYLIASHDGIETLIQQFNQHDAAIGDLNVLSSGKLALEFKIDQLTAPVQTPDNVYKMGVMIYGSSLRPAAHNALKIEMSLSNAAMNSQHEAAVNFTTTAMATGQQESFVYPVQLPLAAAYRLGLYVDQDNGRLGVIINGHDKGYLNTKIPVHLDRLALAPFIWSDLDPTNPLLGEVVAGTVITDARQMKLTYPVGTRDLCGIALR